MNEFIEILPETNEIRKTGFKRMTSPENIGYLAQRKVVSDGEFSDEEDRLILLYNNFKISKETKHPSALVS